MAQGCTPNVHVLLTVTPHFLNLLLIYSLILIPQDFVWTENNIE